MLLRTDLTEITANVLKLPFTCLYLVPPKGKINVDIFNSSHFIEGIYVLQASTMDFKERIIQSLKELDLSKTQLQKKLEECTNENYTLEMGKKLKGFLSFKDLTSQVLHSLVEKITCNSQGEIRIHYNFVNPFQETGKGNAQ